MFPFPVKPETASAHAWNYDLLFWTITGLSIFFTIVVGLMVAFLALRYRAGSNADRRNPVSHSTPLEMVMMGVPLLLAMGIFGWSARNYVHVRAPIKGAMDVFVIGKQWMWHLQHADGTRENNELTIPMGRPVRLTMISQDVIHSMYLPDFRAQYHVVPGRYTQLTFTPIKTGRFKMLCAMHCGNQHSEMVGWVNVLTPAEFAQWQENKGSKYRPKAATVVEAGKRYWDEKRCGTCHGDENTVRGPSLMGLMGKTRVFTDGSKVVANEDYIRQSILEPWKLINKGWDRTMPAYQGQITEEDVLSLIAYIKSQGKSGVDGAIQPYEKPQRRDHKTSDLPNNATDVANEQVSAGAMMSKEQK